MSKLLQLAEDLTTQYFGNKLAIGRCFIYKADGKGKGVPIQIISGYFLDPKYNRLSNHWVWKKILSDGTLGEEGSGYGGNEPFFTYVTKEDAITFALGKQLSGLKPRNET